MNVTTLRTLGLRELEELYVSPGAASIEVPTGVYQGSVLAWLPHSKGQPIFMRPLLWMMFGAAPFGVDFNRSRWFFLSPRAPRLGRFFPVVGASRWRDTRTLQLHYDDSALPAAVRSQLYDEVKPLSEELCLGFGGLNAERGQGEQFFFALEKIT